MNLLHLQDLTTCRSSQLCATLSRNPIHLLSHEFGISASAPPPSCMHREFPLNHCPPRGGIRQKAHTQVEEAEH